MDTTIPARLDRLRWGRFHTLVVVALGITWILDGLEVTLAGAVSLAGDFHEHLGGALRKRQIVLDHRYEIAVGEILLRSDQVADVISVAKFAQIRETKLVSMASSRIFTEFVAG